MSWWSSLSGMWGGGGGSSMASGIAGSGATGTVGFSADVGAPNSSMAYAGGGAVPSGGGGGGGGGGMNLGALMGMMGGGGGGGGGGKDKSGNPYSNANPKDKVGQAVLAPAAGERARLAQLIPSAAHAGVSIGPVASSRGGIQMAKSLEEERYRRQGMAGMQNLARLERRMRDVNALGDTVHQGVGLIKDLVTNYFTGGMSGMSGMGGGGGG
jgi:hypothetical protein